MELCEEKFNDCDTRTDNYRTWNSVGMKTALITGAAGYLGSHLAKTLKQAGWKVVGVDIKHTDNQYIDLFHPCDIRNGDDLHLLFDRVNIDTVFHLAGRIEVGESVKYPQTFFDNNTNGTNVLLDAMKFCKLAPTKE